MVSKGGGFAPRWQPKNGKVLYYTSSNGAEVMAVDVDGTNGFRYQTPRRIFRTPTALIGQGWDIAPDGRFLFVAQPTSDRVIPFTVALNWAADLRK